MARTLAGGRLHHHDRSLAGAEQELGGLLQVVTHRQLHGARVVGVAASDRRAGEELLLGGRPGEHRALLAFELGRAEAERVVAGDVREQVAGRVLALEVDLCRPSAAPSGR
jgi:hypothetical protein